ncbi:MAG TPA: UDP-glucose 4-epimerase [Desulfotomaculum sp.]|nr:MAG: UDP-glucose 4-epimerase [Desulfotomaculum sp. BICA1-6]HBX23643.1 UDP-glucose 4-epimerase [Desulfotomaculum sp.]
MRVLVTGGAGFIGSHIVDALIARGDYVSVLDNLSSGRLENIDPRVNFYHGDIRDEQLVRETMRSEQPDFVIHQAAQMDVRASLNDPAFDAAVNILGTINLLEACCTYEVKKIVYASSAAVYGNPAYLPVDEKHPVQPLSGYGISKHTVEHYLAVYRELHGLNFTALRYANVYGPRQDANGEGGVVAIFTDMLLRGKAPRIHGDGGQTRDFICVQDVARANLAAMETKGSGIYNVSTGVPTTVNQLFETLRGIIGCATEPLYSSPRERDIRHSYLAPGAAADGISWRAALDLTEGLRQTVPRVY